jgi:hypothetical protein
MDLYLTMKKRISLLQRRISDRHTAADLLRMAPSSDEINPSPGPPMGHDQVQLLQAVWLLRQDGEKLNEARGQMVFMSFR